MNERSWMRGLIGLAALSFALPAVAADAVPASDGGFAAAISHGPLYAALAAFASGFLVSLTPCVYPMIAVTVSVFGARSVERRSQGMLLSAAFVLGIVAMFVPLGVLAGLTGGVFGAVLSSPWVIVGLSSLFVLMALSMFGAFELDLPSALKNRLASAGGSGVAGAFVLGLVCGPIAAPCTGPFLTGILAWIAKTQSAGFGAGLMAAFALGLGVPFFVVGAFALQLPKSGGWMTYVKSLLGVVLLVVALYFLSTAFPVLTRLAKPTAAVLIGSAVVALAGILLGAIHKSFEGTSAGEKVRKAAGILLTTLGAFMLLSGASKPARTLAWEAPPVAAPGVTTLTELAHNKARVEGRPLLVDFTAAWCVACKEIDKLTFSDERVQREAGRFVAVKVDATDADDPLVVATMDRLQVRGLPTLILFDSSGKEVERFTEFVKADRFYESLTRVD
jgi:thiol:disulfide interchange protein DsbD